MHVELTTLNLPENRKAWSVDLVAGVCRYNQIFLMGWNGGSEHEALDSANTLAKFLSLSVKVVEHTAKRSETVEVVDGAPMVVVRHE